MQTRLMKVIAQICKEAGAEEKLLGERQFYLKVKNEPFQPLVIEAWTNEGKRLVSVAHYFEMNGDLVQDPEILLDVQSGLPIYLQNQFGFYPVVRIDENGKTNVDPEAQKSILTFMNLWAKNIKHQGFIQEAKKLKGVVFDETV